jgi:heat-inducible transcriptional repressor
MLTARQKKLFNWMVQQYIGTATPVGSDQLVRNFHLDCSAATVRNEMILLEAAGFVKQPHTSAGRVPTDQGYRYYVNSLMKHERVLSHESDQIHDSIRRANGSVMALLEATSVLLSEISEELAVVMTPVVSRDLFDRLELIALSGRKILAVVHLRSRRIKTVVLELKQEATESALHKASSRLNERLSGRTLCDIRQSIRAIMESEMSAGCPVLSTVVDSSDALFDFTGPLEVRTSGARHILRQPEFSDPSLLQGVFSFMEDREGIQVLFRRKGSSVGVVIGSENRDERLQALSVITGTYRMGSEDGIVGIIGPTRMRYSKILPLVEHISKALTDRCS